MRTRILILSAVFLTGMTLQAQEAVKDTTWKMGGLISATFGQVNLSNWASGGFNSINAAGNINYFANYKKGKGSWDNDLLMAYGLLKQGEGDVAKTDDRLDFTSKCGRETSWSPKWNYSLLGNFRTQFTEGLDANGNRISDIMAPAYGLAALGLDYKPSDNFSLFISPVTAKFTWVTDEVLATAGAFGVDPGEFSVDSLGNLTIVKPGSTSRAEFGGYLKAMYNQTLMENVNFTTRLDLFSNYEEPTQIDVNWDTMISLRVNDYITTSLGVTVLYDHDILIAQPDGTSGRRTQFREVFGVGFAYQL
jgi:hypothetical protein